MIRTPLRPLARILSARQNGENPDVIERENIRQRHEDMRDGARERSEGRLLVLGAFFLLAFVTVGVRMSALASSDPVEPRSATTRAAINAQRGDIVDRNGRILATNLVTHSLYAKPPFMVDKAASARELARIFPDLDAENLLAQFNGERKFLWIKRRISPEQQQLVHDIGDPGLEFGPREMRLYPNGRLAAHVLGGASFGREGVHSAEVIGVAGVEKAFDTYLRDPATGGEPLQLSIDLTVQAAAERVLAGGMKLMNARGAASVLMDVQTGEVISLVSLPDFDPNNRPNPLAAGSPSDSPLFNRAVQGVYELGSTFKTFAIAQALEQNMLDANTLIDTSSPLKWGKYNIRNSHRMDPIMSVTNVMVESSNTGTARIAQQIGAQPQQDFLAGLGLLQATPVELVEAPGTKPLLPRKWSEISAMTISYGHGLSVSPMHLAAAYATIVNGGTKVSPTLLSTPDVAPGQRIVSQETSASIRSMLRQVVTDGTAKFGNVEGYDVGGKTGSADKPKATGGYHEDKVIATFASFFPADNPRYVLVVMLDEPVETSGTKPRRSASWTAVPVAAEMIRRTAPLLGLRPQIETGAEDGLTLISN
ncbi:MAG: penicillin-binding protein 2 [Paracoccaceae bacterium]